MGLFDERIPYKPFEYPEYYTEGWLKQAQAFWLHTEIPMSGDVKDWNEKLTKEEKHLVGNILLGFAQTECAVSDYWTQKVVSWFPKHEIQQMAMMFGSQETIHAVAYSYLNETLGTLKRFFMNPRHRKDLIIWLVMTVMILLALVEAWQCFQRLQKALVCIQLSLFYILFSYVTFSRGSDNK